MVFNERMLSTYKGKSNAMGFIKGHIYEIEIEQMKHGYEVSVFYDTILNHELKRLNVPYSSESSLKSNWDL
ncbi:MULTISPECIES: hypothetical protein [unclassified Lacrimispora]|uniref:hypothetical protein n=1 Tax=unclassified Lacrimispora TaxID=2719232 RepID=UPI0037700DA1